MTRYQTKIVVRIAVWASVLVSGCKESEFAGSSPKPEKKSAEVKKPQKSSPTPSADPMPSASPESDCIPGKTVISISAATPIVDQRASQQIIVYNMTLEDCPGAVPTAKAERIEFDLDAVVADYANGQVLSTRNSPIPFKILIENSSQPVTGNLAQISGSDLFGKTGEGYGHYASNNVVAFSAAQRKAKVEVNLSNLRVRGATGSSAGQSFTTLQVNTYFKFGNVEAVTIPITFKN